MKSKLLKYAIIILIVLVIVGGTIWFIHYRKEVEEQDRLEQIRIDDSSKFQTISDQTTSAIKDYQDAYNEYVTNQPKTSHYPEFLNEINQAEKVFAKYESALTVLKKTYDETKKFENNTNIDQGIYKLEMSGVTHNLEICNNTYYSCIGHYNSKIDVYNAWVENLINYSDGAEYMKSNNIQELCKYESKICKGYIDLDNDGTYNGKQ